MTKLTELVSPKVVAAAVGAGGGAVLSQLVLWSIGAGPYGAGWGADQVDAALAAVPDPISGAVLLVFAVVGALVPGYTVTDPARVERTKTIGGNEPDEVVSGEGA